MQEYSGDRRGERGRKEGRKQAPPFPAPKAPPEALVMGEVLSRVIQLKGKQDYPGWGRCGLCVMALIEFLAYPMA